jgi:hypothetical protein
LRRATRALRRACTGSADEADTGSVATNVGLNDISILRFVLMSKQT